MWDWCCIIQLSKRGEILEITNNMKDRIKKVRKNFGLTQSDFGARVGVKGNTIGNYETDLRKPSDAVIFSICREFNINEEWLRTGKGEMFISQTRDEKIANFAGQIMNEEDESFKKQLIEVLSELTIEEWEILEKMALKLAGIKKD